MVFKKKNKKIFFVERGVEWTILFFCLFLWAVVGGAGPPFFFLFRLCFCCDSRFCLLAIACSEARRHQSGGGQGQNDSPSPVVVATLPCFTVSAHHFFRASIPGHYSPVLTGDDRSLRARDQVLGRIFSCAVLRRLCGPERQCRALRAIVFRLHCAA